MLKHLLSEQESRIIRTGSSYLAAVQDNYKAAAMPIDTCPHSFSELASSVLPKHMTQLRAAMVSPHKASEFAKPGVGPAGIAHACKLPSDFSGCYVLLEGRKPIYVGISRSVLSRVRQHVSGKSHFDASLVYSIAQRRRPTPGDRSAVMRDSQFIAEFDRAQHYLRGLDVAFVQIDNPLVLYVFEAYAAMELDTAEWNTFRTH